MSIAENAQSLVDFNEPEALLAYLRRSADRLAKEAWDDRTRQRWRALAKVLQDAEINLEADQTPARKPNEAA